LTEGLQIWSCEACKHAVYPRPLLCRMCAGVAFEGVVVCRGVVREGTVLRRRVREDRREPYGNWGRIERVAIVSVITDLGPLVIARASEELRPGTQVVLATESGSPVASARA
jgi:hypothetical protein